MLERDEEDVLDDFVVILRPDRIRARAVGHEPLSPFPLLAACDLAQDAGAAEVVLHRSAAERHRWLTSLRV